MVAVAAAALSMSKFAAALGAVAVVVELAVTNPEKYIISIYTVCIFCI
jgi:hypothetical protein